jgi:hypothetical protein
MTVSSSAAPLLGVRDPRTSALSHALEVFPCGRDVLRMVDRVVAFEISLALTCQLPKEADVRVGHDRPSGPGNVIETAVA